MVGGLAGSGAFLDLGLGWAGLGFTAVAHARHARDTVAGVLWALLLYQAVVGGLVLVLLSARADRLGRWLVGPGEDAISVAAILPTAGVVRGVWPQRGLRRRPARRPVGSSR
jgi:hypothetical protein